MSDLQLTTGRAEAFCQAAALAANVSGVALDLDGNAEQYRLLQAAASAGDLMPPGAFPIGFEDDASASEVLAAVDELAAALRSMLDQAAVPA